MNRTNRSNILFEGLELRQLMAAVTGFRSIDGSGNNLANADWGSAGTDLLRQGPAAYADGVSLPAGADRPSAREISNTIVAASEEGTINDRELSAFVYAWGQFIDHDMDLTPGASPAESFPVQVPAGDESFDPLNTGTQTIALNRSVYDPSSSPRQQVSVITAWLDGSMVYGSDATRAAALRTFVGGQLKTSAGDLMPFNTDGLANANDAHIFADDELFLAGDVRANENVELSAIHALFLREHNRIAAALAKQSPGLSDEELYQRARQQVGAEIQAITYNEFLPALLGRNPLSRYTGYKPNVNGGIANEFSTAAFRFGHSMVGDDIEFLDNDGEEIRDALEFTMAFFNPAVLPETGIDPILKYLASDRAQEVDTQIVEPLRNFLFGPPGAGGLDLASLNIQRGRDHGLADYNATRVAYGLAPVTSFAQITSNVQLQQQLQSLYGSVDDVDLWVGGLAEDHAAGGSMGPLFERIIADQFTRLRDGDRFWYENAFSGRQLDQIRSTQLSDIIRGNTDLTNLQDNVFVFDVTLSGSVFEDRNANARIDRLERGLAGWNVQLLDGDGALVAETTTRRDGRYTFAGLDLDTYTINAVEPDGWTQTSPDLTGIAVTRGERIDNLNVGYTGPTTTPPTSPQPPHRSILATRPVGPRCGDVWRMWHDHRTANAADLV
jgi:hypothetical protein